MRRTLTITVGVLLALLSVAAVKFFTDYPNSIPADSDFFVLQRNQSYINASQAQVRGLWFTSPSFTGNATFGGNLTVNAPFQYFGDGSQLSGIPSSSVINSASNMLYQLFSQTTNGMFILANNGNGTNTTNWGVSSFDEVDAANMYITNFFTGVTNQVVVTDLNGRLGGGGPIAWTNNGSFTWPAGEPAPDSVGRIKPGPSMFFAPNGGFLLGTNVVQDTDPLNLSTLKAFYAVSMVDSNEPPSIDIQVNSLSSETYDYFGLAELKTTAAANGSVSTFTLTAFDHRSGASQNQIVLSMDGLQSGPAIEVSTNGIDQFSVDKDGIVNANGFSGNGSGLTNLTYQYKTNAVSNGALTFGEAYRTNINADITLASYTLGPNGASMYESLVILATNSDTSVHKITHPSGVFSGGVAAVSWITNGYWNEVVVDHFATLYTNAQVKN